MTPTTTLYPPQHYKMVTETTDQKSLKDESVWFWIWMRLLSISSFKYIHQADFVIPVEIESQFHNVYVIKRPGVDEL